MSASPPKADTRGRGSTRLRQELRGLPPRNSVSLPAPRLRLATRLRRMRKLAEWQIRDYATTAAGIRIQNDLVCAAQHTFHGFEIHALTGDVGRLLVLLVDFQEPRRLAGCFGNRL